MESKDIGLNLDWLIIFYYQIFTEYLPLAWHYFLFINEQ